jgi:uncharacterized protein YndB with AHSA1/START domain
MAGYSTDHGTVVVERVLNVPLARAYGAFADATQRALWGSPADSAAFIYDTADFRVGGVDTIRCGPKEDPRFRVEARYIDIVPERRVVWTEAIRESRRDRRESDGRQIDTPLAANLTTVEFFPQGPHTRVTVTVQVASFVGPAMIENTRDGHTGSLANMARFLER